MSNSSRSETALVMQGVRKRFGSTVALDGVDLQLTSGEVLALIGENGAGKSTLMKILSGALQPDEGSVTLFGETYQPDSPAAGRSAGIGMIYQELSLAPHLSVEENILLGIEPVTGPWIQRAERRRMASAALEELGVSDIPLTARAGDLSPARSQMVEIARSIASGCRILIFDEPTSSLTQDDMEKLFRLIRTLRDHGRSIIYISHFLEEVKAVSDRFAVLRDGCSIGDGNTVDTGTDRMAAMMVGREISDLYPRSPRLQGDPLLTLDHVQAPPRLRNVSLTLHRGEVLGIAGLVGAGRTELLRAVMGLDPIIEGRINVDGRALIGSVHERWNEGLGMISENRKEEGLALNLSITDNLTLTALHARGPIGLLSPARLSRDAQQQAAALQLKYRSVQAPVQSLSGGNQQKVAIGRLLHHGSDVLLMDEPTRGIDIGSKAEIYKLIDQLTLGDPEHGIPPKAVLMVSSYLPELLGVCDRIAVMCKGVLGAPKPVEEWSEHSIMLEATGLEEDAA